MKSEIILDTTEKHYCPAHETYCYMFYCECGGKFCATYYSGSFCPFCASTRKRGKNNDINSENKGRDY